MLYDAVPALNQIVFVSGIAEVVLNGSCSEICFNVISVFSCLFSDTTALGDERIAKRDRTSGLFSLACFITITPPIPSSLALIVSG